MQLYDSEELFYYRLCNMILIRQSLASPLASSPCLGLEGLALKVWHCVINPTAVRRLVTSWQCLVDGSCFIGS